jgi:hypothetical protein
MRTIASTTGDEEPTVGQEGMAAAKDGVARRRIGDLVRLIDGVLERRGRRVGRIPQQRRLVGRDEVNFSGVRLGRVDDPVVPAWAAARDLLRKERPAAVKQVAEVSDQVLEVTALEGCEQLELSDVPQAQRAPAGVKRGEAVGGSGAEWELEDAAAALADKGYRRPSRGWTARAPSVAASVWRRVADSHESRRRPLTSMLIWQHSEVLKVVVLLAELS